MPKKKRVGSRTTRRMEKEQCDSQHLTGENATWFRALAARANYLALGCPDLAFSTKELCRWFATPNDRAVKALNRIARHCIGKTENGLEFCLPIQHSCHQHLEHDCRCRFRRLCRDKEIDNRRGGDEGLPFAEAYEPDTVHRGLIQW